MRLIQLPQLPPHHHIRNLQTAASRDGALLAVQVGDDTRTHSVHWFRFPNGTEVLRHAVPRAIGAPEPVLSADLQLMAFVEESEEVRIVSLDPHRNTTLAGHDGMVTAMAFSPNGQRIATVGQDGYLYVWDTQTGEVLSDVYVKLGALSGVTFSPTGDACIVAGQGGQVAVFDLEPDQVVPQEDEEEAFDTDDDSAPAVHPGPIGQSWVPLSVVHIPANAVVAGHEADGALLYAARATYRGNLIPGKVRVGFGGANVGHRRKEIAVLPFEILVGSAEWAAAEKGDIPEGAMQCGHDDKGTPLYLARGEIGEGLHPGKIAKGQKVARIPFGGVEVEVQRYEVLLEPTCKPAASVSPAPHPSSEPLLSWDFENTMSDRGISLAVGIASDPTRISGIVSQTGGGPAEVWGGNGTVFLTRFLGTNEMFLWFTITRPIHLESLTFRHWHNHNPGFPTCPSYQVQLQLDSGDGYQNVGSPLTLSNATSNRTDTMRINQHLEPGSYKLRWHPRGLQRGRDTNTEFFAIKALRLEGRFAGA